jgi:hypothetical protein
VPDPEGIAMPIAGALALQAVILGFLALIFGIFAEDDDNRTGHRLAIAGWLVFSVAVASGISAAWTAALA